MEIVIPMKNFTATCPNGHVVLSVKTAVDLLDVQVYCPHCAAGLAVKQSNRY